MAMIEDLHEIVSRLERKAQPAPPHDCERCEDNQWVYVFEDGKQVLRRCPDCWELPEVKTAERREFT